jgi:hypothetical protein
MASHRIRSGDGGAGHSGTHHDDRLRSAYSSVVALAMGWGELIGVITKATVIAFMGAGAFWLDGYALSRF